MNMKSAKQEKRSEIVVVSTEDRICSTIGRFVRSFGERTLADGLANWTKRHRSTGAEEGV